jgi:L-ascorbate metabolism protein UlaG (beta-lactamase superfamily)
MGGLTITRVTHAGVLLDFDGQVVLTDPWWVDRTLERHGEPVGVAVADLPRLAGVTVTHNVHTHYDMIGFGAYPDKSIPIVVPRGAAAPARKAGFSSVIELDPWETASLGRVRVTAAPAQHIMRENTYIYEADGWTVYHGGDTLAIPSLAEVARRFPRIDVAFMSVSGEMIGLVLYRQLSMRPEEAAQLCALLKPRIVIPIAQDSGAVPFAERLVLRMTGTPEAFAEAVARRGLQTTVQMLAPGEAYAVPRYDAAPSYAGG